MPLDFRLYFLKMLTYLTKRKKVDKTKSTITMDTSIVTSPGEDSTAASTPSI